jgi:hypothetical protein
MSDIQFSTEMLNKDVTDDIEDAINDGIARGASDLAQDLELVARLKIREEGAVWREKLINSFDDAYTRTSGNYVLVFMNTAEYAAPVNDGAEYGDEGPPISALIPWVQANMPNGPPE